MSRRTRTTATLLVLLLALVVVAPALPVVREAVIDRALGALEGSGITVTYRSSSGNAWRAITLHDVQVQGVGADVEVETLELGYFLPSLLGGELPIDVLVHGATGTLDLKQVLDAGLGDAGGGAAGPVSVRLRRIDLQDIGVDIAQVPFDLPGASISNLSVTQDGTAADLAGVITTTDGSASLQGRYDALTGTFTGTVVQADAAIARHWWSGIAGGSVSGTLTVRGSAIDGDFDLVDGSVDYQGLNATGVSGPVTMRYPVITAELAGDAFGGRVEAIGVVNVAARRWEANGGGTVALEDGAAWLTRTLAPDGLPIDIEGLVDADLTVVGWADVDLRGTAAGSGRVEEMPLEGLAATFTLDPRTEALSVDANATLGGGPVTFSMGQARGGTSISAALDGVALAVRGNDLGTLDASLSLLGDDVRRGTLMAEWDADLAGRALAAQVDATLDPDGWQAFITAQDGLGTTAEGAVVLAGGRVEGTLTAFDLAGVPLSQGARVALSAAGPLDDLTATFSVLGDGPVTLAVGPPDLTLVPDLRGSVSGSVTGSIWEGLGGSLGPLGVTGAVSLSPLGADLDLSLAPTAVGYGETASTTLTVPTSTLTYADGALVWSGTAMTDGVMVGPVIVPVPEVTGSATFGSGADGAPWGVTLDADDGRLVALFDGDGFRLSLDGLPVTGTDADLPVAATVSGGVNPQPSAAGDVELLTVSLDIAGGSSVGPATLADSLQLDGVIDLAGATASFGGAVAGTGDGISTDVVAIDAGVAWGESVGGVDVTAELRTGSDDPLTVSFASGTGAVSLVGDVEPAGLLRVLGLLSSEAASSLSASATADLRGVVADGGMTGLTGSVDVALDEPLGLRATLTGDGSALAVEVVGGTDELPIAASGSVDLGSFAALRDAGLLVDVGPLTGIRVTATGAEGGGVLDPEDLGVGSFGPVSLEPLPWRLTAAWSDVDAPYAVIAGGDSQVTTTLADGRPRVAGALAIPVDYAGERLTLTAGIDGPPDGVEVSELAGLPLSGALTSADGVTLLAFQGTAGELLLAGALPTALVAAPLPEVLRPDGELRVDATLDLLSGPRYDAAVTLTAADASFSGTVTGTGADLSADLNGAGLELSFAGDTLRVSADDASLAPLLPPGALPEAGGAATTGVLDGTLVYDAGGWRGALTADLSLPLGGSAGGVVATVALLGRGASLELSATGTGPAATRFDAGGTVTPTVDVSARLDALDGMLTADLGFTGDDGLRGTVTSSPVTVDQYASLPAQSAALSWRPGESLRLVGDGIDLTAGLDEPGQPLTGTLSLPFTLLDGSGSLTADLGGSLTAPSADLQVLGSGLRAVGSGTLSAANATLTLHEPALGRLLPDVATQYAGLIAEPVTARADWTADDGWTLTANGVVAGAEPKQPGAGAAPAASLDLDLAGVGARFSGGLGVSLDGRPVATASIAGVGSDVTADLDLATVEWSAIAERFGVDLVMSGGGAARLTTAPLGASLDVDLAGTVGGLAVSLRGSAPNDLAFTVQGDDVDLDGRVAWDQEQRAVVTGTVEQRPVEARLMLDDALTSGRLVIDVPGAQVRADLTTAQQAAAGEVPHRDVAVEAALDGSSFGGLVASLTAALSIEAGVTTLEWLQASTDSVPGPAAADVPLYLTASGVVSPALALDGTLTAPTLGETAELRVANDTAADAITATLSWRDLLAVYDVAAGTLRLSGAANLGEAAAPLLPEALAGLRFDLDDADLTWSAADGFDGGFTATIDAPALDGLPVERPLLIRAAATPPDEQAGGVGPAGLRLSAAVRVAGGAVTTAAGQQVAVASVVIPADVLGAAVSGADANLEGSLDLDADIAALLSLPGVALNLTGTVAIGGSLSDPNAAGDLALTGDVAAAGSVTYQDGAATLSLIGPELRVDARADSSGWLADATLERLPLGTWLTQVADPHLSLDARADSATGTRVIVENLVLESGASRLTGAGTIDTGLRVLLQAQVDLADLRLGGTELRGLMRGPVALTAPSLDAISTANVTAQLDAAGIGVAGVDASVSGSLQLGGNLADPVLNAGLQGTGALTGGLRLSAAPTRGRVELTSTLAYEGVMTDLQVMVAEGVTQARGQLRYQELVLFLSDEDDGVILTGAGRLDGWSVTIEPDLAGASVTGDLARLLGGVSSAAEDGAATPANQGAVAVTLGSTAASPRQDGEPWLRGTVADLVVAGQRFGDFSLSSDAPGEPIRVDGATMNASFSPRSTQWSLSVDDQPVPGDLALSVEGSGTGMEGALAGRALGDGAVPIDVTFTAALADDLSVTATGTAFGGRLDVDAGRPLTTGEWRGTVSLDGAEYGGMLLRAVGTVQGTSMVPQAVLTTSLAPAPSAQAGADRPLSVTGLVSVGSAGVTIDQTAVVPALGERIRVRGRATAPTDLQVSGEDGGSWRLVSGGASLRAAGAFTLDVGPATITLGATGPASVPTVTLALASTPNLAASTELEARDLLDLVADVNANGLRFTGTQAARGTVTAHLTPVPSLELEGFGAEVSGFDLEVSGSVSADDTDLSGSLVLPAEVPALGDGGTLALPLRLSGGGDRWELTSDGALGTLDVLVDLASQSVTLDVDLALPGTADSAAGPVERGISSGSVVGRVVYDMTTGASGTFAIADVVLAPAAVGPVTVNADVAIADGRVGGAASIDTSGGRVTLTGDAVIAELLPGIDLGGDPAARGSNLELRVRTLDLSLLPGISASLPHLNGALSGVVQLRNGVIVGQLVAPELAVGERLLPTSLQLSGVPTSIDAALVVAGTLISGQLDEGRLTGSARLERFPLELVGEAFVGPTDVSAALTGVLRFDVPLGDATSGFVRIATEEVRLERAGVVTLGNVVLTYDDRSLVVDRADFGGMGTWNARGVLSPEVLDFTLEAVEADFSPLLGLFPDLARYGVGAAGSFTFTANGSFAAPEMVLASDSLDIGLAGTRYRIEGTSATLSGVDLTAATTIRGLDPLVGALDFSGGATVMLEPLALRFVDFGFAGSLSVPGIGVIDDINGAISQDAQNNPTIELSGMLGAPLTVSGTLVPLDLRAGGTGLDLSFPALLIGSATASVDLRLEGVEGGLELGGSIQADEIVLDPGARAAAAQSSGQVQGDQQPAVDSPLATSEAVAATEAQGARNALAALAFDDLRITAPQRVLLALNIASIEAALDLTLSGTAADPQLSGTAEALRGSLRFSGREFTLDSGVATFTPSRGVYPDVTIAARTEFERARVLSGSQGVRFVSPAEGQTFTVDLAINSPVEQAPPEEGGFRFDVRPILTSEALVEVEGEGVGTGVRALTEAELLSLITLGRVEFGSDLIGAGGLGGAVAQGALDTAVDLLIVGELQNALREALGLDVVEIRTSALSSLLEGDTDQFGVSVRLGGYLNPELFASYRIGTTGAGDTAFGLSNEVALSYALGPLDLDIMGRIDFPAAGTLASPRPELGLGLRYDFGRTLGIDAGVTLSTQRSVVSFGVALRW